MKNQALFSLKDKKLKCRLLHFLFGTLRVKYFSQKCQPSYFIMERYSD